MVWGSYPDRGKRFFCSPKRPDRLWGPPSFLFSGYWDLFLGVKRSGRDNHSPPSSANVRYEWSCTSTPPMCFHKEKLCLFYLFLNKYFSHKFTKILYLTDLKLAGHPLKFSGNLGQALSLAVVCTDCPSSDLVTYFCTLSPFRVSLNVHTVKLKISGNTDR
jgi:hypothetical protein